MSGTSRSSAGIGVRPEIGQCWWQRLLDRFGSNIRSQEGQSQLVSISSREQGCA